MKVILVDDGDEKVGPILGTLESAGISSDCIDVANCVNEAKRLLRANQYGLAILDLSIGVLAGGAKSDRNGMDLIRWSLDARSGAKRPWKILVVTSIGDTFDRCQVDVEALNVPLLKWESLDASTVESIKEVVRELCEMENFGALEVTSNRIDICLVSALLEPEYSTICEAFSDMSPCDIPCIFPNSLTGILKTNDGSVVRVLIVSAVGMGGVPMANLTSGIVRSYYPKTVIMHGICGGLPSRSQLGDLICATEMVNFGAGKMFDGIFKPDSSSEPTSVNEISMLEDRARMEGILTTVNSKWSGVRPDRTGKMTPEYIVGQTGCSDMVIADSKFVDERLGIYRKMVGVEMEGYGAGYVVRRSGKSIRFLLFKSVCDMADPEKRDKYQKYCAFLSAGFVREIIQQDLVM
jgi:nucleoside phosphorylase